jgi:hypothetical protein
MKEKKNSIAVLDFSFGKLRTPSEAEERLANPGLQQASPELFIGPSYSTKLWTFYMFDLMGITLMRRSAAAATRKKSSNGSIAESYLPSTETLRRALKHANGLAPTKAN